LGSRTTPFTERYILAAAAAAADVVLALAGWSVSLGGRGCCRLVAEAATLELLWLLDISWLLGIGGLLHLSVPHWSGLVNSCSVKEPS